MSTIFMEERYIIYGVPQIQKCQAKRWIQYHIAKINDIIVNRIRYRSLSCYHSVNMLDIFHYNPISYHK